MKVHLLTFRKDVSPEQLATTYPFCLLLESAKKLGHTLEIFTARDCQIVFGKRNQFLLQGKPMRKPRVVLTKPGFTSDISLNESLIRQIEAFGCPVVNGSKGVSIARNKLTMLQALSEAKIPIPTTYVVRSADHISEIMSNIGAYPVILKTPVGNQGIGVSIVESKRALRSVVQMLVDNMTESEQQSLPLMLQEYIRESKGRDIRIFVIGDKVVAAMERRTTKRDEFRSNFKLGGKVRVTQLSQKEKKLAIAATKACFLDYAGVDLLRTKSGPKILEVNANPGLEGITQATGIDVAGKLIEFAVEQTKK